MSRPVLSAAQCQPLTENNFELCCIASNRRDFLTPEQAGACPPITTALIARVLEEEGGDGNAISTRAEDAAPPSGGNPTTGNRNAPNGNGGSNGGSNPGGNAGGQDQGSGKGEKNNNGLGNGSEPGDSPQTGPGADPSNPGNGGKGEKGGKGGSKK